MLGQRLVDRCGHERPVALVDEPVMDRHRAALGFDEGTVDRAGPLAQPLGDPPDQLVEAFGHVTLDPAPLRGSRCRTRGCPRRSDRRRPSAPGRPGGRAR